MNKKASLRKVALLIVSCAAVIILAMACVMEVRHMRQSISVIKTESLLLKNNEERLAKLKELEKAKPELENALGILNEQIPQTPQEYELLGQLQKLMSADGTELLKLQFAERIRKNDVTEMPFTMSISASYNSFVKLLDDISTGSRLIRIDEIQISKKDSETSLITADISASAFFDGQ